MIELNKHAGTYNHCSNCKLTKNCCCDFDDIDNIVTTIEEKNKIIKRVGLESEKYFKKINDDAYNIMNIGGICPLYNNGCSIYDIRPSDCRLFPYDLKEIDGKYYLIRYDLSCGSKNVNENVYSVIKALSKIISTYTDKEYNEKLSKFKYKIIKEIQIEELYENSNCC